MSAYEPRKKWMSSKETQEFWSIKSYIGNSCMNDCIIDINGKYGMIQHSTIDDIDEGNSIKKY